MLDIKCYQITWSPEEDDAGKESQLSFLGDSSQQILVSENTAGK